MTRDELRRLSYLIEQAGADLRAQSVLFAKADRAYAESKHKAWASVPKTNPDGGKRLAAEIEAEVEFMVADIRHDKVLADLLRQAALEDSRSRRQQLSALQSWMAADRAEAEFARTGPA